MSARAHPFWRAAPAVLHAHFGEFVPAGDGAPREIAVDFLYSPGCAERGPSYASGGEPAEGPSVEIGEVSLIGQRIGSGRFARVPLADAVFYGAIDPDEYFDIVKWVDKETPDRAEDLVQQAIF